MESIIVSSSESESDEGVRVDRSPRDLIPPSSVVRRRYSFRNPKPVKLECVILLGDVRDFGGKIVVNTGSSSHTPSIEDVAKVSSYSQI